MLRKFLDLSRSSGHSEWNLLFSGRLGHLDVSLGFIVVALSIGLFILVDRWEKQAGLYVAATNRSVTSSPSCALE
jgi:hypothetical protein